MSERSLESRLDKVEGALVDIALLQREVVELLKSKDVQDSSLREMDSRVDKLETDVAVLKDRVGTLWKALGIVVLLCVTVATGVSVF